MFISSLLPSLLPSLTLACSCNEGSLGSCFVGDILDFCWWCVCMYVCVRVHRCMHVYVCMACCSCTVCLYVCVCACVYPSICYSRIMAEFFGWKSLTPARVLHIHTKFFCVYLSVFFLFLSCLCVVDFLCSESSEWTWWYVSHRLFVNLLLCASNVCLSEIQLWPSSVLVCCIYSGSYVLHFSSLH